MPGTSNKTEQVTVRLPVDLIEWIKTQSGSGKAEVITQALLLLRDGPVVVEAAERVAELEAEVKRLRALSVDRSIQAAGPKRAVNQIGRHAAGPILEPTLNVRGTAQPFFRPGTTGEKATKPGR